MQTIYNLWVRVCLAEKKTLFLFKNKKLQYVFNDGLKKREKDVHTFKVLLLFNDVFI